MLLGYGKGINAKHRTPFYGFERVPIIDQINSGQLEEVLYVDGEGIVETKKAR